MAIKKLGVDVVRACKPALAGELPTNGWRLILLLGFVAMGEVMSGEPVLTGVVLDAENKPAADVEVATFWRCTDTRRDKDYKPLGVLPPEEAFQMQPFNSTKTDADGRFTVKVPYSGRPMAIMALDKERKRGAAYIVNENTYGKPATLKLGPLVHVFGTIASEGLGKLPPWTNVYANLLPDKVRVAGSDSTTGRFSLLLPPGRYQLNAYGTDVKKLNVEVELKAGTPDVDLKVLNLEPTIIARHYGKPPPEWTVTDARGVGKDVKLADFKGKWVLLEFWGFW